MPTKPRKSRVRTRDLLRATTGAQLKAKTTQFFRAITARDRKYRRVAGWTAALALGGLLGHEAYRRVAGWTAALALGGLLGHEAHHWYFTQLFRDRVSFANASAERYAPLFERYAKKHTRELQQSLQGKNEHGGFYVVNKVTSEIRRIEVDDPQIEYIEKSIEKIREGDWHLAREEITKLIRHRQKSIRFTRDNYSGELLERALASYDRQIRELNDILNKLNTQLYDTGIRPEDRARVLARVEQILREYDQHSYGIGNLMRGITHGRYRGYFNPKNPEQFLSAYHVHAGPTESFGPSPTDVLGTMNSLPMVVHEVTDLAVRTWNIRLGQQNMVHAEKFKPMRTRTYRKQHR